MRCLAEIDGRKRAESFVSYLLTADISTQIECTDEARDRWELWIRDEDKLEAAQAELDEFLANPNSPKYQVAVQKAADILAKKDKARQQAAKNIRRYSPSNRTNVNRGPIPPLTLALTIICVVLGFFNSFGSPKPSNELGTAINNQLSFVTPAAYLAAGEDPLANIRRGEVWRIITPIFLHGDVIHLAMNMFVLISFGRIVERWLGTPRYAMFVLVLAVVPNLMQGLAPAWMQGSPFFVGISGVLYGFFAYVWVRTSINPSLGISIPMPMVLIMVGIVVAGLAGLFPDWHLAHLCHLGGLLIGAGYGFASEKR